MNEIKEQLKYTAAILILLTYVILLFTFDVVYTNLNFPDSAFGTAFMVFATDEYEPQIKENSIVWIKRINERTRKDLAVDDFIIYKTKENNEEYTICQQLKRIDEGYLYFQTIEEDGREVKQSWKKVYGVVECKMEFLAPVVTILLTKEGRIAFLVISAYIFIGLIYTGYGLFLKKKEKLERDANNEDVKEDRKELKQVSQGNDFMDMLHGNDERINSQNLGGMPVCPRCGKPLIYSRYIPGKGSGYIHEKRNKCKAYYATKQAIKEDEEKIKQKPAKKKTVLVACDGEKIKDNGFGPEKKKKKAEPKKAPKEKNKGMDQNMDTPEIVSVSMAEFEKSGGDIFKLDVMRNQVAESLKEEEPKEEVRAEEKETIIETAEYDENEKLDIQKTLELIKEDFDNTKEPDHSLEEDDEEFEGNVQSDIPIIKEDISEVASIPVEKEEILEEANDDEEEAPRKLRPLRMPLAGKKERIQELLHQIDENATQKKEKRAVIIRKEVVKYVAAQTGELKETLEVKSETAEDTPGVRTKEERQAEDNLANKVTIENKKESAKITAKSEPVHVTSLLDEDDDDEYGKTCLLTDEDEEEEASSYRSSLIDLETGVIIEIDRPVFTIGCKKSCNMVIEQLDKNYISRVHAIIYLKNDTAYIKDVSSNGTALGDEDDLRTAFLRLPPDTEVELKDGICIKFPKDRRYIFKKGR